MGMTADHPLLRGKGQTPTNIKANEDGRLFPTRLDQIPPTAHSASSASQPLDEIKNTSTSTMKLRQLAFHGHRNITFCFLGAATSAFAFTPTSTAIPVILALSTLLVYAPFLFRSSTNEYNRSSNVSFLVIALSLGSCVFRLQPSLQALSTPGGSIAALSISSALLSSIAISTLFLYTKLSTRVASHAAQLLLFPALWATVWCTVAALSPVGHLSTWSIADHADAYNWMTPLFGTTSKDWIVGAWAVVLANACTYWYMGVAEGEDDGDLFRPPAEQRNSTNSSGHAVGYLAALLVLLAIPSFILPNLPLPAYDVESVTPLSVACVMPPRHHAKGYTPTLKDYLQETNQVRNNAKLLLWPEGAVSFSSRQEREDAFELVRRNYSQGAYVGVSFEEVVADESDPRGLRHYTRTGLALLHQDYNTTLFEYYKRNLVPVAESYRLRHSTDAPSIYELPAPMPKGVPKDRWGKEPRPIPLTASICLDFATLSPFSSLESRPGIILAPARTWDRAVGQAMWLQAKQRAAELNTMVLWCDGGEGGVSGVAGGGFNDPIQVGAGSFVQTIGVQYPFDSERTVNARFGDSALLLYWILVVGPESVMLIAFGRHRGAVRGVWEAVRRRLPGRSQASAPTANLIDYD